jgi:hypothetical protein
MLKLIGICPVPKSVLDPDPTNSAVLDLTLKQDQVKRCGPISDPERYLDPELPRLKKCTIRPDPYLEIHNTSPYYSLFQCRALNLPVRATRIEYSGTTDSCKIGFLLKYLLDLKGLLHIRHVQYEFSIRISFINTNMIVPRPNIVILSNRSLKTKAALQKRVR